MALQEEFEKQGLWLFRYRGVLPVIILVIGFLLFIQTELNPDSFFIKNSPYEIYFEMLCLLISLFGLFIRICVIGFTPKNTSGRTVKNQVADSLNTTGMYSLVRHPLYVGNYFMWLGPAILSGNLWFVVAFTLFYWVYYERIMYAEEQFLRNKFGKSYIDWSNKVPAFVPDFKNFIKANLSLSWKKVVRKEITGIFVLFAIFFVFDYVGVYLENEKELNPFLLYSMIFLLFAIAIIKVIKKYTNLLKQENR
ncbi:methyltransferase family protein [Flavobacterium cheniae]|jgi:protein-S-isoprenylcysteine O-methyltransferase Ste14|uniref:Lipid A phosphate methyltransferase n=1 Tax=Flavobacterium cheniae TaxID=295428 RepID=A0A562KF29_9FLAO|nr:isoprenylcysteine carboxylmethyltransferase family protein [Flavobacterium cheniae]TDR26114.1 protein-S-isoprenylcysteine O-methyltransferase Ste14 [Flavobacterium cheniae]TWH93962.1 lipid A phosphate methyltransferase [Flavobacterium cheniae]